MSRNTLWQIAFGDYDFALDRRNLTYDLIETKTSTIWADGLSVGWLELENRETGERTRHTFADMRLVSLSEKSGQQGKRILLGLDCLGIPVDLYFICSQKEIQLTVEASRDTATYRVQEACLLPGLVSVPADDDSHLVVPYGEGCLISAHNTEPNARSRYDVWHTLKMPFIGAVRIDNNGEHSAIAVSTDSAYASAEVGRDDTPEVTVNWLYARDPERRRLDLRLSVLPGGDHVAIAQAYRSKLLSERNHVTLRRKIREQPDAESLLGSALIYVSFAPNTPDSKTYEKASEIIRDLHESRGIEHALCLFSEEAIIDSANASADAHSLRSLCGSIRDAGFLVGLSERQSSFQEYKKSGNPAAVIERIRDACAVTGAKIWFGSAIGTDALADRVENGKITATRWDDLDERLRFSEAIREFCPLVGASQGNDWASIALNISLETSFYTPYGKAGPRVHTGPPVPLTEVVYHDSVIAYSSGYLRSLLRLSPPQMTILPGRDISEYAGGYENYLTGIQRNYAVLGPLHRLSFAAFLSEHRFLTPDFMVEEARYTNGAYVLINQSKTENYESERVMVPPQGFYVEHPQMIAHDALRVGEEQFTGRAFRISRSRDGKPLTESVDILRQEFSV